MRKRLCSIFCSAIFAFGSALSNQALAKSSAPASSSTPVNTSGKPSAPAKGLHRLDFRLEHASCPSCILKVRKALRATPGIEKCEIALRKPYGGVVIFEPAKVNAEKMQQVAREADPNKAVELTDLLDQPITAIPTLLLPKYTTLKQGP